MSAEKTCSELWEWTQQTSNRVTVEQTEITQQDFGGIKHVNVIGTPLEEYNLWSIGN
ncbi:hypothetical protein PCANC_27772 [Puccinia coronata f. sp. avenae]|uniref:Uncharacterized protein n=1 Tax=Puccinia coronata f. sp. avenae TaxID=200324 RepID=A0A2N5TNJ8_9BASI|nr:hypothetical protein PCANC_27772 [Puccinia coronata f. sp. avenae]